jgi:H+/Cl- antiporter ClcA
MFSARRFVEGFVGPRRRLFLYVVIVGAGGALLGAAYVAAMHGLQRVLWPTHWAVTTHLAILAGVGAAVGLLTRFLGSPGDVELLVNNIHLLGGPEDIRDLRSLIPVSLLCIASGGGMGPEAPLVQTTGSWGAWFSMRLKLSRDDMRILTITGMAAGFTVLFGAPLGSAIFALEILHRRGLQYYEALLPSVIGGLVGYTVYATLTHAGLAPIWRFPPSSAGLRPSDLVAAVGCGIGGAIVATVFTYLATGLRVAFRSIPPGIRPLLGGLALGGLAFWSPYALTFGEAQIDHIVVMRATALAFLVAAVAKLCGTSITLSSGWRGGFIIPMFFIGVALGRFGHAIAPGTDLVVLMSGLMAANNVGVTKTALGTTLIVTEMTGIHLLPTTLLASVIALLLTSQVSLIHTQQERESAYETRNTPDTTPGAMP